MYLEKQPSACNPGRDLAPSFATALLKRILPTIGATLISEPINEHVGLISFANGRRCFYRDTIFNINPVGSCETAIDKHATTFFLKHFGYKATDCIRIARPAAIDGPSLESSLDQGYRFAEAIGFPVILKPNTFSEGKFVTKVFCREDFYLVAATILKVTDTLLVERFYPGNDYRLVVLDGTLVAAYRRHPLSLIGDGMRPIKTLLCEKQDAFHIAGMGVKIDVEDFRIALCLKRFGMSLDTVLPSQKQVYLLDNANLSSGGTSHDVTNQVHPDYTKLATNICSDMLLRLCGVDIITEDISWPMQNYVIIEINSAPGMRHFASTSPLHDQKVERIYRTILGQLEQS